MAFILVPTTGKKRLAGLVDYPSKAKVETFIRETCKDCLEEVRAELESQKWQAEVSLEEDPTRVVLHVDRADADFTYEIRIRGYARPEFAMLQKRTESDEYFRAEVFLRQGGQAYDVYGFEKADIINDVLNQFENYLAFQHHSPSSLPWDVAQHDDDLNIDEEPEVKS